jgi:N6-adenosine-specific RNA methylase IME4
MAGKPQDGRKRALTPTEMQRRWRAKKARLAKYGKKLAAREARMATLKLHAEQVRGALEEFTARYPVILADCPWDYAPYSRITGMDRSAENHYPVMDLAAIKALKIPAADNCALFLWATVPMLPQALEAMAAWGFEYRSHLVWVKDRIGTGYWARNRHELLLIGVRGDVPAPIPGEQPESVIAAPRGRHSEKPTVSYEIIEKMFAGVPRLEMFARCAREGWASWGAEAPTQDEHPTAEAPTQDEHPTAHTGAA